MTTTVSWPASLPDPVLDGFGIDDDPPILRSDFEMGAARQRKRFTAVRSEFPASWALTQWEFMIFEGFEEHDAKYGAEWFAIDLQGSTGWAAHEARFKGKTKKDYRGGLWVLTGTLEVRERPKLSDAEFELLKDEDPVELEAALTLIHETRMIFGSEP